jgi:DNA invertase Pin-like site-specific DNA recombinase
MSQIGVAFPLGSRQAERRCRFGRKFVKRVQAGLANARAKGISLGRPKDRSAELRIIDLRKQGLSLREIAHREKRSASGVLQILRRAATFTGPK